MDRRNLYIIRGMFLMNSFTEALRGRKRRTRLETRRSVTTGGCFVNYFLRVEGGRSLSLTSARRGSEETGIKKKAKIGVQTESARKDGEHEEEEEEEERVGEHCDCLALTFASHILPSCQWHSTGEFSGRHQRFLLKD